MKKLLVLLMVVFFVGCASRLKVPDGWTIVKEGRTWATPYAKTNTPTKTIYYNSPMWCPWNWCDGKVLDNAFGRIYGISDCDIETCMMYYPEAHDVTDDKVGIKVRLKQIFTGYDFCDDCEEYLKSKDAFKEGEIE